MELKTYQKNVIQDLSRYLELLLEKQSAGAAYTALWNEKNVLVGLNGMPNYNDVLKGVPNVCFKVPTGGGSMIANSPSTEMYGFLIVETSA